MLLSVIIPAYNEENTLEESVNKVKECLFEIEHEIIVIDDSSTDRTAEIIKSIQPANPNLKALTHSNNQGKGAAIRNGFSIASGELIITHDADFEYDPKDIIQLLKTKQEHPQAIIYGSRFLSGKNKFLLSSFWANKFLSFLSSIITGLKITDMETCYKLFDKEILSEISLQENKFGIEPEFTKKMARLVKLKKYEYLEIPISYQPRTKKQGKKINYKDGIAAIFCLLKY